MSIWNWSRHFGLTVALTSIIVALAASPVSADDASTDWPQWRGPNRDGYVMQKEWPASVAAENLKQVWRVELGPSYSGPVVVDGKVFTTETADKKLEVAHAIDLQTGETLWSTKWEGTMRVPFFARSNGDWIRSTPAYDDGRLYVAGMRDVLVCLDAKTGDEIWRVDFVKQLKTPLPAFGCVCSPIIVGNHLYVQAGASLAKLDKRTGEIIWRALEDGGGTYGSAFSSPTVATLGNQKQLLVQTRSTLAGVDLDSADVLWSQKIAAFRGMNILTPIVHNEAVFTSSYGGRTFKYAVQKKDDNWSTKESWDNKAQGYMSSPVVIDDHVYMHLRNQRFTCIDLETGEAKWTTKPFGKYWSLVTNGKQILALDERGELLLINANPKEFNLVETRQISDSSTWAYLALSGKTVVVRDLNALAAYRW